MRNRSGLLQSLGLNFSRCFALTNQGSTCFYYGLLLLLGLLAFSPAPAQQLHPDAFILSGAASRAAGNCFRLTGLSVNQTGGLFYNNKILLSQDFDLEFDINFGDRDQNGADGLAFVLQNSGTTSGQSGEGLGYQGLRPSLAVEFDTWQNAYDPPFDHIGILRNGDPNHFQAGLGSAVQASPTSINIEDGQPHRVRLHWMAAIKILAVYFDNNLRLSMQQDIATTIFSGNGQVYWGFTAATGGSYNNQSVCLVKAAFRELLKADVTHTNALCPAAGNGSITVTGKGGQGPYWYSIDNGASFQDSPSFPGLRAGTYLVRVKDTLQALSPAETVVITEPASMNVSTAVTPGCFGALANTLAVSASGGTAPYAFSIDGGATYQASGRYLSLAAGTYQVRVKDANGCVAAAATQVTSLPEVTTGIAGSPADGICAGEAVTLRPKGTAPPGTTFAWLPGPGLTIMGDSARVRPTATATYTLVTTTAGGCTERDSVTVVVKPGPVADAGPDQRFCSGGTVTVGTPALPGYSYRWVYPNMTGNMSGSLSAMATFTKVNTGTQPDTITLTLIATHDGCVQTDEVRVVVVPRPVSHRISGSASVCPGVTGVTYTIADPAAAGYRWEISGGILVSGQGTRSITVNWGPTSSTANIKAYGVTPYGCPLDTLVFPVRINPLLITPGPTGPTLLCSDEAADVHYQTQYTNGSVYAWTVIGGTLLAPTTGSQVRIRWDTSRRGKLVVTESSTTNLAVCFGASDTLFVDFNFSPDASLSIGGPAAACAGAGQLSYSLAGLAGSTYRWTLNGSPLAAATPTVALDFASAGTYTLTAQETSPQGCVGPVITKTITIHPLPAAAAISGPADICPENLGGHAYSVAGGAGSSYAWTVTGGTIRSGQGTSRIVVDFDASASKAITVLETSAAGCTNQQLRLSPRYDPSGLRFALATTQEQDPEKIALHISLADNSPAGNGQPIRIYRKAALAGATWTQIAEVNNVVTDYVDASAETSRLAYFYRLENLNNCGTALPAPIHKTMLLQVQADEAGETVTLQWNSYRGWPVRAYEIYRRLDGAPDYTLYRTVPATDSSAVFVSADEGFVQQFRIKALPPERNTAYSWSNAATATFENAPAFFNVFTPDGDGRNEVFYIDNVQLYPDNELTVYNRYGKEVYRQKNYRNAWNGDAVTAGTYYYLFKLRNGQAYKGWVEIVK